MSSDTSTKVVAVCGATGRQGGGTVAALLRLGGFRVRALTRSPASPAAAKLAQPSVEVVKADFEDPASLKAAFQGCHAVFAVTDFWVACQGDAAREKRQGMNIVDAAKAAGVDHFVWSTLEDTRPALAASRGPLQGDYIVPHFDAKAEVDAYMREQLPGRCTSVYTSIFYENLLPRGGLEPQKQPDGSYALFIPTGDTKLAWCSTPDIGGVAAGVIAGGVEVYGDKSVPVAGEHATVAEVAATFTRVFGKQVAAVTPPPDDWVQAVMGFGVPEPVAKDLGNMFLFYATQDMCKLRPVEGTRAIYPATQGLQNWMEANRGSLEALFD